LSECDIIIRPLHPSSRLDMLSQDDFTLKLLPLCLGGDCHATLKDHVDFCHMLISVGDLSGMFSPVGILGCRRCWRRHLFTIQKSFALFQIMSISVMDLTPLLCVVGASEASPFLLIGVLLLPNYALLPGRQKMPQNRACHTLQLPHKSCTCQCEVTMAFILYNNKSK
jgi:hypothetical protein